MHFCPTCKTVLLPTQKEKGVIVMTCRRCGYTSDASHKVVQVLAKERENVVVIGEKEKAVQMLPKTKSECQKCGNGEAYYWQVQTRGGDEASTQFFRCTACGSTWRESS